MRTRAEQSGFTIIETILFLAISSALIFSAMSVVTGRTQSVRFDDGIRSLESFIDRRISNVRSGSIINADQDCSRQEDGTYTSGDSDGSCIFLGYSLRFGHPSPSQIEVYQLFGARLTSSEVSECTAAGETPIMCADPTILPDTPIEVYDIPWSLDLTEMLNNNSEPAGMVAFVRSPGGTSIIPVAFDSSLLPSDLNTASLYTDSTVTSESWYGDEVSLKACYSDEERKASISIGSDQRQLAIETTFNDSECSL